MVELKSVRLFDDAVIFWEEAPSTEYENEQEVWELTPLEGEHCP